MKQLVEHWENLKRTDVRGPPGVQHDDASQASLIKQQPKFSARIPMVVEDRLRTPVLWLPHRVAMTGVDLQCQIAALPLPMHPMHGHGTPLMV